MIIESRGSCAHSYDIDDTLVDRGRLVRVMGLVNGIVRPNRSHPLSTEITPISRVAVDLPIQGIIEQITFNSHAKRRVTSKVRNALAAQVAQGIDLYGNTGRPNKQRWVDMTWDTLTQGQGANFFKDIFFTPALVPTAVSKAEAIARLREKYERVEHFDDDPRTAIFIARLFPDVTVHLIHYGTTAMLYSHEEHERYPNIKRSGRIGDF